MEEVIRVTKGSETREARDSESAGCLRGVESEEMREGYKGREQGRGEMIMQQARSRMEELEGLTGVLYAVVNSDGWPWVILLFSYQQEMARGSGKEAIGYPGSAHWGQACLEACQPFQTVLPEWHAQEVMDNA